MEKNLSADNYDNEKLKQRVDTLEKFVDQFMHPKCPNCGNSDCIKPADFLCPRCSHHPGRQAKRCTVCGFKRLKPIHQACKICNAGWL